MPEDKDAKLLSITSEMHPDNVILLLEMKGFYIIPQATVFFLFLSEAPNRTYYVAAHPY